MIVLFRYQRRNRQSVKRGFVRLTDRQSEPIRGFLQALSGRGAAVAHQCWQSKHREVSDLLGTSGSGVALCPPVEERASTEQQ